MTRTIPAITLILIILAFCTAKAQDGGVTGLYERAQRAYFQLKADEQRSSKPEAWLGIVEAYKLIIDSYPNDPLVDDIVFITGGLYREIYQHFGNRTHLEDAVAAYRTILRDYPASYLQQAALYAIGQVQEEALGQPEAALDTYRELVERFPKGYKTAAARNRITLLGGEVDSDNKIVAGEGAGTSSGSAGEHADVDSDVGSQSGGVTSGADPLTRGEAVITDIRTSFGSKYGRVTIELNKEVPFRYEKLPAPKRRIFFDLEGVRLSGSNLKTFDIPISNRYLKRIRLGQFKSDVTRVVLDFDRFRNYRIFTLPSPYRIVFDLIGAGRGPAFYSAAREAAETRDVGADSTRDGRYSLTRQLGAKVHTIVIDPGHGGKDPGAVGLDGLTEKELALDIARRLKERINKELPDIDVKLTRDSDIFLPLEQRTAIAKSLEADLFFSIHANSTRRGVTSGAETYYMNFATDKAAEELAAKENAYSEFNQSKLTELLHRITLNNKKEESRELAGFLQTNLVRRIKGANGAAANRGVKSAPFVVLIGADIPSVLVEVSFINHPVEGRLLHDGGYRERIAQGLLDGIKAYIESLQ